jgi:alpha-2-macroglobulin
MKNRSYLLVVWWTLSVVLVSCHPKPKVKTDTETSDAQSESREIRKMLSLPPKTDGEGLVYEIREASGPSLDAEKPKQVKGEILDEKTVENLMKRTGVTFTTEARKKDSVMKRSATPPPERTREVETPLGEKKSAPEARDNRELKVVRYAPEGNVPLAPHVSVTFSRPMIPVSGIAAARELPVKMTPLPQGHWEWLGTETLIFRPATRLPMATGYSVEIPSTVTSLDGTRIKAATKFTFQTPPLQVVGSYPTGDSVVPSSPLVLAFNQSIDAEALMPYIEVTGNGKAQHVRVATDDEVRIIFENELIPFEKEQKDRLLVLLSEGLMKGAKIQIRVKKNAPSAEGPIRTDKQQTVAFSTYRPLEAKACGCGGQNECRPDAQVFLKFNNNLDFEKFSDGDVTVNPPIENMMIGPAHGGLYIMGMKNGKTEYRVRVSDRITDVFGQKLDKEKEFTFTTTRMTPALVGVGQSMVILSPFSEKKIVFHAVNHDALSVTVHRMTEADLKPWLNWMSERRRGKADLANMPGKKLIAERKQLTSNDRWQKVPVNLTPYLENGYGQFAVVVAPVNQPKNRWQRQEEIVWVQITDIGISTYGDATSLHVAASELKNGEPLANVKLQLFSETADARSSVQTDEDGYARMALSANRSLFLTAKKGNDMAIQLASHPGRFGYTGFAWTSQERKNRYTAYLETDRGMYKPGETVNVKGWIRETDANNGYTLVPTARPVRKIKWKVTGPRGLELGRGTETTSLVGGFDFKLKIPGDVNTGTAHVELMNENGGGIETGISGHHYFEIQEFRKPEFEVTAQVGDGPHIIGATTQATLNATFYSGEPLGGADVHWTVSSVNTSYSPPNHGDFSFGKYNPWWGYWTMNMGGRKTEEIRGITGGDGAHRLNLHFKSAPDGQPSSMTLVGTAMDINRQQWSASTEFVVHPASRYVGLKLAKNFIEKNESLDVSAIVTDIDGRLSRGEQVVLSLMKNTVRFVNGKRIEEVVTEDTCEFTSEAQVHICVFRPEESGGYQVIARTADDRNRKAQSDIRFWVGGDDMNIGEVPTAESIYIIPGKDIFAPNDKATMLIKLPFYPAAGFITLRKGGIRYRKQVRFESDSAMIEVPLTEAEIPEVNIHVDVSGVKQKKTSDGKQKNTVAFASGMLSLKVSAKEKRLDVDVIPDKEKRAPGETANVVVNVKNSVGHGVSNAELAIWVVDEAVLALSGYRVKDPVDVFYTAAPDDVVESHSRSMVLDTSNAELSMADTPGDGIAIQSERMNAESMPLPAPAMARGTGGGLKLAKKEAGAAPIAVRTNFDALAFYAARLTTDKAGMARVHFTLPDSLTRYRIVAVAADGANRFGNGESTQTSRLPLMIRPSAPRFLHLGDKFEFPVVLQNATDEEQKVDVAIGGTNVAFAPGLSDLSMTMESRSRMGRRVTVSPGQRVELRFPALARHTGKSRFVVVGASAEYADSSELVLPVWTPSTAEAFATYGTVADGDVLQKVKAPENIWPSQGGLEVTTSSTGLQSLADAFIYLTEYPYECSEQLASRIIAIATLKDVVKAFRSADIPSDEALNQLVTSSMLALARRQQESGGFGLWDRESISVAYVDIHVTHALAIAKQKGYIVDAQLLERALDNLRSINERLDNTISVGSRNAIWAYGLYVRNLFGEKVENDAIELLEKGDEKSLSMEAKGWLLACVKQNEKYRSRLLQEAQNRVTETGKNAHFITGYTDGDYVMLHSDRRADAIWLDALLNIDRDNTLIPKLASGLLDHRKNGRWLSTQENAFVLIALDTYFQQYEKEIPDFVSRVWLGNRVSLPHGFKGRSTESTLLDVPMNELDGEENLIIEKNGRGRMYYRIGMTYVPASLHLEAENRGFTVMRRYTGVDDAEDVWQDDRGTWHVKAGARVKVELTMVAPERRYHVALVDELPAGLEPVNPALAVDRKRQPENSGGPAAALGRYWWWQRPWFEHQNLRDERVEAFTSLLWDGVYTYSYEAKATTPGEFVAPPATVHEMYSPETFGRSGTDRIIID